MTDELPGSVRKFLPDLLKLTDLGEFGSAVRLGGKARSGDLLGHFWPVVFFLTYLYV